MRKIFLSLSVLVVAACTSAPAPQPAPAPAPPPPPPPPQAALPVQAPLPSDWRDWPITPGDWVYRQDGRGSIALFGAPGRDALLTIRCDTQRRRIYVSRAGQVAAGVRGQMTVRTTAGDFAWPVSSTGGTPPYVAAALAPTEPGLDKMIYSRGRFVVDISGMQPLAIPAWAEFARVVEDCRGPIAPR